MVSRLRALTKRQNPTPDGDLAGASGVAARGELVEPGGVGLDLRSRLSTLRKRITRDRRVVRKGRHGRDARIAPRMRDEAIEPVAEYLRVGC